MTPFGVSPGAAAGGGEGGQFIGANPFAQPAAVPGANPFVVQGAQSLAALFAAPPQQPAGTAIKDGVVTTSGSNTLFAIHADTVVTSFSEAFTSTTGSDTFTGGAGNTSFYFPQAKFGGTDSIDGGAGTNQVAFDGLNNVAIHISATIGATVGGDVDIRQGFDYSANGTHLQTLHINNINQFLTSDTTVASLAQGFITVADDSTGSNSAPAAHGTIYVTQVQTGGGAQSAEVYIVAGTTGADTFTIDSTHYPNLDVFMAFGHGGGDTFNINDTAANHDIWGSPTAIDTVDYTGNADANANGLKDYLGAGTGTGGNAHTSLANGGNWNDRLYDVDSITHSSAADTAYVQGGSWNILKMQGGNDHVYVESGASIVSLDGGNGTDSIILDSQQTVTSGVTLTLGGSVSGGITIGTLTGFESVTGTHLRDVISGTAADETFNASDGNDTINGGGGQDHITLSSNTNYQQVVAYTSLLDAGSSNYDTIDHTNPISTTVTFSGNAASALDDISSANGSLDWAVNGAADFSSTHEALFVDQAHNSLSASDLTGVSNALLNMLNTLGITAQQNDDGLIAVAAAGKTGIYAYTEDGGQANNISGSELKLIAIEDHAISTNNSEHASHITLS
ncbi:MAG: hypothetical protein HY055_02870 [Magnetospirillum sp.]|nr:hypothetical protein [Magnetospirillum sp.]